MGDRIVDRLEVALLVLILGFGGLYLVLSDKPLVTPTSPSGSTGLELLARSVEDCIAAAKGSWNPSNGVFFEAVFQKKSVVEGNTTLYEAVLLAWTSTVYRVVFTVNGVGVAEMPPRGILWIGGPVAYRGLIEVPGKVAETPLCPAREPVVIGLLLEGTDSTRELRIPAKVFLEPRCIWLEALFTEKGYVAVAGSSSTIYVALEALGAPGGHSRIIVAQCTGDGRVYATTVTSFGLRGIVSLEWMPLPLKPGARAVVVYPEGSEPVILPLGSCMFSAITR